MDTNEIKNEVKTDVTTASKKWVLFRKWLSAHPLTGFWGALVLGAIIGYLVGLV
jgi:hypothetical protein